MEAFKWEPDPSMIKKGEWHNVVVSSMPIGPEQRRVVSNKTRKMWEITFKKDKLTANQIWQFYLERRGAFEAFTFRCPLDGIEYKVRFAEDDLERTAMWRRAYEFGLKLIEVI